MNPSTLPLPSEVSHIEQLAAGKAFRAAQLNCRAALTGEFRAGRIDAAELARQAQDFDDLYNPYVNVDGVWRYRGVQLPPNGPQENVPSTGLLDTAARDFRLVTGTFSA